jgi:hypothetical protein
MALYRFRVSWEEDDQIYRDIELQSGQTFQQFGETIVKAWEFDGKHASSFFESDDRWERGREFSSEVETNKKGAPALSMKKTPVSALVFVPNQKFIYEYDREKKWTFQVELIAMVKEEDPKKTYPLMIRKEGLGPAQYGIKGFGPEKLMEVIEINDLSETEIAEGFSSEGSDESTADEFSDGGGAAGSSDGYDD